MPGDAAATATAIAASEALWRWGLAVHLLYLLAAVVVAVILYELFKPVQGTDEGQKQAQAYLAIRLFSTGWGLALLIFAGFCVLTGVLIRRSRLIRPPSAR